ncbi:YbjN domain-containing protein [Heliorestis acidaminivorans]|uniref:YbjN domain-containing protein n=1 Tax=Heliorestis acidaminivorans TaxID=553427 RepID=A0A6I0F1C2_9FIRM|nr:YbjN domain-containing protein [Heliorestis acidaminivorans]KAB2951959.1 YbjN domain-containing protein [Heliorestis acidaminivorans]
MTKISLYDREQQKITVALENMETSFSEGKLLALKIDFNVDYNTYLDLESKELLNLNRYLRGPLLGGNFDPDKSVIISARLNAQFLQEFPENCSKASDVLKYLISLSQSKPEHLLFNTENWFSLNVKQHLEVPVELQGGNVLFGYSTAWAYAEYNPRSPYWVAQDYQASLQVICEYLKSNEYNFKVIVDEGHPVIRVQLNGNDCNWETFIHLISEPNERCIILSICPEKAQEKQLYEIVSLLMTINYTLSFGNFESDIDDGEVRFKTALDINHITFTPDIFGQLFYNNVVTMNKYLPSILNVIKKDAEATGPFCE